MDEVAEAIEELLSDPGLVAVPAARGRKASPVATSYVRDLTAEDILALETAPPIESETPFIAKLRSTHHNLARLLAEGIADVEASMITGYSISRISLLRRDPAFSDLLSYYEEQKREIFLNVHERLSGFGLQVLEELQERLDDNPEKFTVSELRDLMTATLDRGGYGPKSTTALDIRITPATLLEAVKNEVKNRQSGQVKTLNTKPLTPISGRPDDGPEIELQARHNPPGEAPARGESQGEEL